MQHYLTYQHNVQRLFREHREKYSGVVIPLSIATAFPSGTYGFVRALCAADTEKQYAIDPRNALFQKAWNRENVRDPHRRMAATLGDVYSEIGLSRPLQPSDFADDAVLAQHVFETISFQRQFCQRSEDARKLAKYKKLLGLNTLTPLGSPQHLIPPYYQFSSMDDPWLNVNQRCIEVAIALEGTVEVRPILHFLLWTQLRWPELCAWLTDQGLSGIWLYPNDFHEHDQTVGELRGYRSAVQMAKKSGLSGYSLFGGYFAVLMSYFGMEGFSNGIGYGEWRDSGYHRGGTATTRVYLLKLHRYVDSSVAQSLIERDPEYFGCDTEIVSGYVESGESLVKMEQGEALDHFMECRQLEIDFVQANPIQSAIAELRETIEHLKTIGKLEFDKYGTSLANWADSLG